ncbi:pyridoxamine 5'-phosphate oxidase family protein [Thermasporomyces composti]|nr:pyridoxamine 5'-phosphate oxidase family protein [Thermasporomyces composti]
MRHRNGIRELDRHECLRRLPSVPIGRIVYTHRALPAVLPVNFSLDDDFAVVIRTAGTSRFARAVDGVVVAFEADAFDTHRHCGWSVVVTGRAFIVTDPVEQERLRRTGPTSWAPTPDDMFVRIEAELVSGREIYPLEPPREGARERLEGGNPLTPSRL